ncbi:unnamed protein product, partial [Didymodactylos carnosus]
MASSTLKITEQPRVEWYWKSNHNPWLRREKEEWTKYSDIESEIIEEAFNGTTQLIELDNYLIDLNDPDRPMQ